MISSKSKHIKPRELRRTRQTRNSSSRKAPGSIPSDPLASPAGIHEPDALTSTCSLRTDLYLGPSAHCVYLHTLHFFVLKCLLNG